MRKKLFVSFIILSSSLTSNSQVQKLNINLNGKIFKNPTTETLRFQGTPYTQVKFAYAEIENVAHKHFMRYNAYGDTFEFITFENDTLAIDNADNYGSITFTNPHKKYSRLNYISNAVGRVRGYLIELYTKSGITLYKKESVTFYPGKKARNTLESDLSPRYSPVSYFYFFTTKTGNVIPFPDNKKQLIRLYPDKKSEIEAFVKENKIDFDADSDRIKIIEFLAK